jgi:hypothetical protein
VTEPIPDFPIAFGYKSSWLAIRAASAETVARAFKADPFQHCNWHDGFQIISGNACFVCPEINGWVLVVGDQWFDFEAATLESEFGFLRSLSRTFGEVQLFSTYRTSETHSWARIIQGQITRAYAYCDSESRCNFGNITIEERELLFKPSRIDWNATEENVIELSELWSINPTKLDQLNLEPSVGILCFCSWKNGV